MGKKELRDRDEVCLPERAHRIPKGAAMDCTTVAAAPTLTAGYVIGASRIADRRMILAGYRLADLLTRVATK